MGSKHTDLLDTSLCHSSQSNETAEELGASFVRYIELNTHSLRFDCRHPSRDLEKIDSVVMNVSQFASHLGGKRENLDIPREQTLVSEAPFVRSF